MLRHFTAACDGVAMAAGEVGAAALAGVVATRGAGGTSARARGFKRGAVLFVA